MRVLFVASVVALSAGAAAAQDVVPVPISAPVDDSAEAVFRARIWKPIVQAKCVNCHVQGGVSGHTRLVFERGADAADHLQAFAHFLEAGEHDHEHAHLHGHELILIKIQGAGHGGGVQVPAGSDDFHNMDRFLALLESEAAVEEEFHHHISQPIVQSKCVNCHVQGGVSGHTRLVLARSTESNHEARNVQAFRNLVAAVEAAGGTTYVLNKIQAAIPHGGGVQVAAGSDEFHDMEHFLELLEEEPHGFVESLLEALDDAETSMMFAITTPANDDTVAGSAVAVSATGAPSEAVHFAYRSADDPEGGFAYLGAAANRGAALYAWDTTAMMDGAYELAALYTEDAGDSVTHDAIDVAVDNVAPAEAPDIEEEPGSKEQAVRMDAMNEVVTAGGVKVTLPGGALDADDRITIAVMGFPETDAAPGVGIGTGTIDVTLDSGQSTFREAVTVAIPYYEGRPDGIVHGTDIPETELSLWFFDDAADAWERVAGSMVQPDADLVTADVTQPGEYGIFHAPLLRVEMDGMALTNLDFGAETTALTFTVLNGNPASQTLTWTIDPPAPSWLSVAPERGDAGSETGVAVTVSVDRTGLESGDHTGTLRVRSNGGTWEVSVSMRVPAAAGDGGGGGCAALPVLPGGPPDPTLMGLLGLVTAYLVFGRRRLRRQAAVG